MALSTPGFASLPPTPVARGDDHRLASAGAAKADVPSAGGPSAGVASAGVASAGASLSLRGVTKRYGGGPPAVEALDLDIARGEFLTLLGASGSGKTTTLMMVAGFTPPDDGEVLLDGRAIQHLPPERRGIGVVFQNYALFPHMSALRNVAFPLAMRGTGRRDASRQAEEALARVGLAGLGHRLPSQLSGGQQQRVALARALVFSPGLLLMDEPLGALDRALRERMKDEIRRLHREIGMTVLYVTHDQEEALTLSDRIALMHRGRIAQIGSPSDLYERPASRFVASFIGAGTLVAGHAGRTAEGRPALLRDGLVLPCRAHGIADGVPAVLLLRPEKLLVTSIATGLVRCAVTESVYVGDVTRLALAVTPTLSLTATLPNRAGAAAPRLGTEVGLTWDPDDAALLPDDTIHDQPRTGETRP